MRRGIWRWLQNAVAGQPRFAFCDIHFLRGDCVADLKAGVVPPTGPGTVGRMNPVASARCAGTEQIIVARFGNHDPGRLAVVIQALRPGYRLSVRKCVDVSAYLTIK